TARRPTGTPNDGTGAAGHERLVGSCGESTHESRTVRTGAKQTAILPTSQCPSTAVSYKNTQGSTEISRHRRRTHKVLRSSIVHLKRMLLSPCNFRYRPLRKWRCPISMILLKLFTSARAIGVEAILSQHSYSWRRTERNV